MEDIKVLVKGYQTLLDDLKEQKKNINKEIDKIKKDIEGYGLIVENGIITENLPVYGLFWDFEYYSHFDGYKSSAVIDYDRGAYVITKEQFDKFREILNKTEEPSEEDIEYVGEILQDIEMMEYQFSLERDFKLNGEFRRDFKVVSEDLIEWMYCGERDSESLCPGSKFQLGLTTKKEIKAHPYEDGTYYD